MGDLIEFRLFTGGFDVFSGVTTPGYFRIPLRGLSDIPDGYDSSATAAGCFYAACIYRGRLPCIAAVIKRLLDAGG